MTASVTPSRFVDIDDVRARYGDRLVERIVSGAQLGDEPADRLVSVFREMAPGEGWRRLESALVADPSRPVDGPPELRDLLATTLAPPPWVDLDLVDAGAVAWWRLGAVPQLLVLTAGSLAYGYSSASLSRPLVRTGRLAQRAPRRLGETARWTLLATRPGAMRPGGAGLQATVRLRLVHALVRRHLRAQPDWDTFNWGEPISATDTVNTGMVGFLVYPLRALRDIGAAPTAGEREAMAHLWAWICFAMGAPEELIPGSYAEAVRWADAAMALDSGSHEESPDLLRALLFRGVAFERMLPGPAAALARAAGGQALGACARRWMGDARADDLRAPDTPLKHLVPGLRPLVAARHAVLRTGLLGSDTRLAARELAMAERALDAVHTAPRHIEPETVEREPALAA